MSSPALWAAVLLLSPVAAGTGHAQLNIVLDPASGIIGTSAEAAFNRAAATWEARLADPITINIQANFSNLGGGGVAAVSSFGGRLVSYTGTTGVRQMLVNSAAGQPNNAILNSLPTSLVVGSAGTAGVNVVIPTGQSLTNNNQIFVTQANWKALGGTGSGLDGTIQFNTSTGYDFNRSNGVTGTDFETVAVHEIGHILGFNSGVDDFDTNQSEKYLTVLDLFRFSAANKPAAGSASDFQAKPRDLRPGQAAVFSDTINEYDFSTGQTQGDGFQASHWKNRDSSLGQAPIGVMDPQIEGNSFYDIFDSDLRAFDLMGYELVPVPEPGWLLAAAGPALGLVRFARRRRSGGPAAG